MLKRVVKLGAVALFLVGLTLCATYSVKRYYPTIRIKNVIEEKKDNELNGVEPASYIEYESSVDTSC